jgi:hypothetical protein
MRWVSSILCLGFAIVLITGCTANPSQSDCLKTTEQGIKTVPHVEKIRQIFSNAPMTHFIEQHGLKIGETKRRPAHWNTVVWFEGRYELSYQTLVVPDYNLHSVSKLLPPQKTIFVLCEITNITDEGRGASFDSAGGRSFTETEWNKIAAARGDFSVIGVHIKTNAPIAGIENFILAVKEDTWAIKE